MSARLRLRAAAMFAATWAAVFAVLAMLHFAVLTLPYYWDEAGYYIPAAYDFFRWGTLVPRSTLTNAHPPLPSIYLAAWWRVFGFHPLTTRLAVCAVSALALIAVYRIALAVLPANESRPVTAIFVAGLTAIYPVWFAQATLAHADIFAACATLWGVALLVHARAARRGWTGAALWLTAAALAKETAVVTPLALAAWCAWCAWRDRADRAKSKNAQRGALCMMLPAAALACWYAYHWHATGYVFGNPEYLRYNATGTLHLARLWYAVPHRAWHLAGHMNLWVAGIATLILWLLPVRAGTESLRAPRPVAAVLTITFCANAVAFSILGGALLTRYLLPLFPLVILWHVHFWQRRSARWPVAAGVVALAFIVGWTVGPPYAYAPEDNLAYAAAVRLQQHAIARLRDAGPTPTILTAWPVSDYLQKPELGYVTTPMQVAQIRDFTARSLVAARESRFDEVLLFQVENPQSVPLMQRLFGHANQQYFGMHDDVPPALAARMLGGSITWQQTAQRQYVGIVRVDGAVDASLASADTESRNAAAR